MDKDNLEQKILFDELSNFFKSLVSIFASLITASIIGTWVSINNMNIEQVRQSDQINALQQDIKDIQLDQFPSSAVAITTKHK